MELLPHLSKRLSTPEPSRLGIATTSLSRFNNLEEIDMILVLVTGEVPWVQPFVRELTTWPPIGQMMNLIVLLHTVMNFCN